MALNFPASPAEWDVFAPGNGIHSYIYLSGRWAKFGGTAMPYNRFVNPAFQINEQNGLTDGSNVAGLIMAEQYNTYFTTTGTWRGQRLLLPTPGGGKHRLRISMTVADTALVSGEWLAISTGIEGNRMADFGYGAYAQYGVVRFGCKAPAGTYCFNIRNNAFNRSLCIPFTVTAAQANTDTVFNLVIPPCNDGTWATDNTAWGWCYWVLDNWNTQAVANQWITGNYAGHTSQTNTFMLTAGNTFELFDVGFYLDPNVTGVAPSFVVPHFEDDLADCQRYWYRMFTGRAVVSSATQCYSQGVHPVPLRANPAMSIVGSPRFFDLSVFGVMSTFSHNYSDPTNFYIGVNTATGGFNPGRMSMHIQEQVYTNYIAVNARL